MNKLPLNERRAISINEFCSIYGVSRGTAYNLMNSGVLKFTMLRKRRMVLVESAESLLKSGSTKADRFGQSIYSFDPFKK